MVLVRVGYLVVGVMEDIPPWNMSPLHALLLVLKDPMNKLQMVCILTYLL